MTFSNILVTGATGWVGRSFLHELQLLMPASEFLKSVSLYASRSSSIISTAYSKPIVLPVHKLSDMIIHASRKNVLIIHTAFLTKDKLKLFGADEFINANNLITSIVSRSAKLASHARIIHISSGAAKLASDRQETAVEVAFDPYGFLKLREEFLLSASAETQTYRVYALTGRYVVYPRSFAIGDFLLSAVGKKRIHVRANSPVIRGYVNASVLAKVALSWLFSETKPVKPLNAVTHIITLRTLADQISKMFDLPEPILEPSIFPPNTYSSSPLHFISEMKKYRIKSISMHEQILDTAMFLNTIA